MAVIHERFALQSLTATGPGTALDVADIDELGIQLTAPVAWSAVTVAFEVSIDGTNYVAVGALSSSSTSTTTVVTSTTATGIFTIDVSSYKFARINVTARTAGTIQAVFTGCRRRTY